MDLSWIATACDIIILIGAVLLAFDRIIKPIGFFKKKQDESFEAKVADILAKVLPEILYKHDLEVRDKYKADRAKYIKETTDEVMSAIQDELTQLDWLKQQYDVLILSAKDVLRAKIMAIYEANKRERKMPLSNKEALEQYYIDYKALKGNSYIDKYYNRMMTWPVYDDEDSE